MVAAPKRACHHPRCPRLTTESYCEVHAPEQKRRGREYLKRRIASAHANRGTASERGYDQEWRQESKQYLRENPLCRNCLRDGQYVPATQVDHIIPHRGNRDLFWDRRNWQGLDARCHGRKSLADLGISRYARVIKGMAEVTIVCGPPASGKTAYVEQHHKFGDLIVDLDAIGSALTGLGWYEYPDNILRFALAAKESVIRELEMNRSGLAAAWVITSGATKAERVALSRRLCAKVVMLDTPADECLRRVAQDERRSQEIGKWKLAIDRWWKAYEAA